MKTPATIARKICSSPAGFLWRKQLMWLTITHESKIFPAFKILLGSNIFFISPHQPKLCIIKNNIHILLLNKTHTMFTTDGASQAFYQFK